jgi:hypothetical protein
VPRPNQAHFPTGRCRPSAVRAIRSSTPRRFGVALGLAVLLAAPLAACQIPNFPLQASGAPTNASAPAGNQAAQAGEAERFTQFTDIPIPAGAELDLDELLVLGTEDGWIGRLPLEVRHDMTDMYSFYEREMPLFGWERVTFVRAEISTMTYARGDRIATITLYDRATDGSKVNFTVAPAVRPTGQTGSRPISQMGNGRITSGFDQTGVSGGSRNAAQGGANAGPVRLNNPRGG